VVNVRPWFVKNRKFKRRNGGTEHGKCRRNIEKQKYAIDMKTTTEQHTRKDDKPRLQHTCTGEKIRKHTCSYLAHQKQQVPMAAIVSSLLI